MIKNYNQFNESIKSLLIGPTEEEIWKNFEKMTPDEILILSCKMGYMRGVKKSLEMGSDVNSPAAMVNSIFNKNYDITQYLLENGAEEGYAAFILNRYDRKYPPNLEKIKNKKYSFVDEYGNPL